MATSSLGAKAPLRKAPSAAGQYVAPFERASRAAGQYRAPFEEFDAPPLSSQSKSQAKLQYVTSLGAKAKSQLPLGYAAQLVSGDAPAVTYLEGASSAAVPAEQRWLADYLLQKRGLRLERELGSGVFGAVYLVTDVASDTPYALKVLFPDQLAQAGESAASEYDVLASLEAAGAERVCPSPNVVCYYGHFDFVDENGKPRTAIQMEFVDGRDLHQLKGDLRTGSVQLEPRDLRNLLRGTLDGLAFLHERGVAHRDLHPKNVLLSRAGQPILTDLIGCASCEQCFDRSVIADFGHSCRPESGIACDARTGNLPYVAPAIARTLRTGKKPSLAELQSGDVWAVLIMMYELLSNKQSPTWAVLADKSSAGAKLAALEPSATFEQDPQRLYAEDPALAQLIIDSLDTVPTAEALRKALAQLPRSTAQGALRTETRPAAQASGYAETLAG